MRIEAGKLSEPSAWRVYDHLLGQFLKYVIWADDETNQIGIWTGSWNADHLIIDTVQRRSVVIIPPLSWVAVDLPADRKPTYFEKRLELAKYLKSGGKIMSDSGKVYGFCQCYQCQRLRGQ